MTAAQLTGYSLPLSPSGRASMLTPPPWHFTGEVIMIDYRVDPERAAGFLPLGLDPGDDPGAAAAVFASWQWCSDSGAELGDPVVNRFEEFLLLLGCRFDGRPMARCPFAWVDEAVPLVRGWVQGMPKQYGVIRQSRAGAVGRAAPRLAPGGRFCGVLSVAGRRVVEAAVTLTTPAEQLPALHTVPLAHSLTMPGWVAPAAPPVLVASEVSDVEFGPVWSGTATLELLDPLGPDLAELAPLSVTGGHVFSYAETLRGGRVLHPDPRQPESPC